MKAGSITDSLRRLQGAHWFFNGFAAARPAANDEGNGSHTHLQDALSDVGEWLASILDGKRRTIAPGTTVEVGGRGLKVRTDRHDGGLLVVTYAEMERMLDGCRSNDIADRADGLNTARRIVNEYVTEALEYSGGSELPF